MINKKLDRARHRLGVVAGLVASPRPAGFVGLDRRSSSVGRGRHGVFLVARLKQKIGYDDSLEPSGVHGMCGTLGALARGCSPIAVNPAGTGLFLAPEAAGDSTGVHTATAVFTASEPWF